MFYKKPPIGVLPKSLWNGARIQILAEAISRYTDHGLAVPIEWVTEYNSLVKEKMG